MNKLHDLQIIEDEAADFTKEQWERINEWRMRDTTKKIHDATPVFIITVMRRILSTSAWGTLGIAMRG